MFGFDLLTWTGMTGPSFPGAEGVLPSCATGIAVALCLLALFAGLRDEAGKYSKAT
ncbi:MAG: hypothetical protein AAFY65_13540 [Pseudomonadota bacterium]